MLPGTASDGGQKKPVKIAQPKGDFGGSCDHNEWSLTMTESKGGVVSQFLSEGDHVNVSVPSTVRIGRIRSGEVRVIVEPLEQFQFVKQPKPAKNVDSRQADR